MLFQVTRLLPVPNIVIPVPLHASRLRSRGFNQSALLAGQVAKQLGVPLLANTLIRLRDTASQAGMNRAERLDNLRNAFAVRKETRIKNRRVLLVDDIITTSATIRAAASVLTRAGAECVAVAALARTPESGSPVR